jgi:hypothetical protein
MFAVKAVNEGLGGSLANQRPSKPDNLMPGLDEYHLRRIGRG